MADLELQAHELFRILTPSFNVLFNIILPSTSRFIKCFLSFKFSKESSLLPFFLMLFIFFLLSFLLLLSLPYPSVSQFSPNIQLEPNTNSTRITQPLSVWKKFACFRVKLTGTKTEKESSSFITNILSSREENLAKGCLFCHQVTPPSLILTSRKVQCRKQLVDLTLRAESDVTMTSRMTFFLEHW